MFGIISLAFLIAGAIQANETWLIVSGLFAIAHAVVYHKK